MTISRAEAQALRHAFEREHRPVARALAELNLHGNAVLEDHGLLDSEIATAFEGFIIESLIVADVGKNEFAAALAGLERLSVTLDELKKLPD